MPSTSKKNISKKSSVCQFCNKNFSRPCRLEEHLKNPKYKCFMLNIMMLKKSHNNNENVLGNHISFDNTKNQILLENINDTINQIIIIDEETMMDCNESGTLKSENVVDNERGTLEIDNESENISFNCRDYIGPRTTNAVLAFQKCKCRNCDDFIIEIMRASYIVTEKKGGKHRFENLEILCKKCLEHKNRYNSLINKGSSIAEANECLVKSGCKSFKMFYIYDHLLGCLSQAIIQKKIYSR